MVRLIMGSSGTGKTKQLIEMIQNAVSQESGSKQHPELWYREARVRRINCAREHFACPL